ncbi:MAG: hypothetical protein J0M12_03135 [Deltaproteobacteria bacterium]|nr:hypothetical protein [Deltaproteobacteria bacterium]
MDAQRFRSLAPRQRALVAVALLLDGREAEAYLEIDSVNGEGLKKAAADLAGQDPEVRMPYVGSALRAALKEIK